jgi:hypothetical protein
MDTVKETLIRVLREWNGWRNAEVRLGDLEGVHWFQPNGAPHALIHGYVRCTDFVSGDLPHDCRRSESHRLLVCVLKRHMIATAWAELTRRADANATAFMRHASLPAAVGFQRRPTA